MFKFGLQSDFVDIRVSKVPLDLASYGPVASATRQVCYLRFLYAVFLYTTQSTCKNISRKCPCHVASAIASKNVLEILSDKRASKILRKKF